MYTQTVSKKEKLSSTVLAFLVIFSVLALIFFSNIIAYFFSPQISSIALFFMLGALCYLICTKLLMSFKYTLDEDGLLVERYLGKRGKVFAAVLFEEMESLVKFQEYTGGYNLMCVTVLDKKTSHILLYKTDGKKKALMLHPSLELCEMIRDKQVKPL